MRHIHVTLRNVVKQVSTRVEQAELVGCNVASSEANDDDADGSSTRMDCSTKFNNKIDFL